MKDNLNDLPQHREVITKYDLWAKKSLGQNFLLDLNLTMRIARAAGSLDQYDVIEVGPGPGGLTRALLTSGARHVYAIERDQRCISAARDIAAAAPGRLSIIEDDAINIDHANLGTAPRKIVANLPYTIATPLLLNWLKNLAGIESMTLMFQKEVAERIVAEPGSKTYGRLSVITQWLCDTHMEFSVSPKAFTPPPKVTSAIITLIPGPPMLDDVKAKHLERLSEAVFGQRRKMLRASLKQLNIKDTAFLAELDIAETARPEELNISEICKLARAVGLTTG